MKPEEILRLEADLKQGERQPVFEFLPAAEVLKLPPKEWLVQNIIGPSDMGMVFGEPGTGKTFVLLDLAFAAITEIDWADTFTVARPLTVAYCTGEGLGGVPQRIKAACSWFGLNEHSEALKRLVVTRDVPQLFDSRAEKYITNFCEDWLDSGRGQLDILLIDTLHNATIGSKENDSGDAGIAIDAAKIAQNTLGCAVLFAHHANRSGTGYRGSSAYEASMDVMLETQGKSGPRTLNCFKSKDGPGFQSLLFKLEPASDADSVYVDWQGLASEQPTRADELLAEMMSNEGVKLASAGWGRSIDIDQKHANNILTKLYRAGRVERGLEKNGKKPSKVNPWLFWYEQKEVI